MFEVMVVLGLLAFAAVPFAVIIFMINALFKIILEMFE